MPMMRQRQQQSSSSTQQVRGWSLVGEVPARLLGELSGSAHLNRRHLCSLTSDNYAPEHTLVCCCMCCCVCCCVCLVAAVLSSIPHLVGLSDEDLDPEQPDPAAAGYDLPASPRAAAGSSGGSNGNGNGSSGSRPAVVYRLPLYLEDWVDQVGVGLCLWGGREGVVGCGNWRGRSRCFVESASKSARHVV